MAPRDVSFTVRAKDEASAILKQAEHALATLKESAIGLAEVFGVTLGAAAFGEMFKTAIERADEAELNLRRVALAVRNVGASSEEVMPQLQALAEQMSNKSKFRGDEIISTYEKLVEVSGDAKGSLGALQLTLDLAAAKHIELEKAATLVGRVMDGNTSMLKRYGIVVKEGDDALAMMATRFRGFAEGEASTFSGKLAQLKNGWTDFLEVLGRAILSNGDLGASTSLLISWLAGLAHWIEANDAAIGSWVEAITDFGIAFVSVFGALADAYQLGVEGNKLFELTLKTGFLNVVGYAKAAALAVTGNFAAIAVATAEAQARNAEWEKAVSRVQALSDRIFSGQGASGSAGAGNRPGGVTAPPLPKTPDKDKSKEIENLRMELEHLVATTANAKTKAQEFEEKLDAWERKARNAHMGTGDLNAGLAALGQTLNKIKQEEANKAFADVFKAITAESGTALEKLAQKGDETIHKLELDRPKFAAAGDLDAYNDYLALLGQLKDASLAFATALEATDAKLRAVSKSVKLHSEDSTLLFEDLKAVVAIEGEWTDKLKALTPGTKEYAEAEKELASATKEVLNINKLLGDILNAGTKQTEEARKAAKAHADEIRKMATEYASLGRSIIAAGQALGIFDAQTSAMLQNVVSLGQAIADMFAATTKGDMISAVAGAVTSLGAIVKQAFGGNSAEAIKHQQVMDQNTSAIQKLTQRIGEIGIGISGTDLARAQAQMAQMFGPGGLSGFSDGSKAPSFNHGAYLGLDDTFLKDIAKKLGITIDDTAGSWRKLKEALDGVSGHLAQFGTSLSDQQALGNAAVHFFGLTGTDAFAAQNKAAVGASPILQQLFGGQSIGDFLGAGKGDPSKISAALAGVMDIFKQLSEGKIGDKDLGGLTGGELMAALTQLFDGLTALTPAAAAAGAAVLSAAQMASQAAAALSTKWDVYGTGAGGQASDLQSTFGYSFDLSTQAGRDSAITALEAEYEANKADAAKVANIRQMLHAIRALPAIPVAGTAPGTPPTSLASLGPAVASLGGASSLSSSAVVSATIGQADQMVTILGSIFSVSQQIAGDIRAMLTGGGGMGGSNTGVIVRQQNTFQFNGPVGDPRAVGAMTADALAQVNIALADTLQNGQAGRGVVTR